MSLPTSEIEVEKRGLGGVTTANDSVYAVIGCSSDGPLLTARKVQRRSLNSTFVSGPAVSATQIATDGIDSDVIFVRVPSTARAAIKTLDLASFTGDSTVVVTGTATIAGDIRIKFTTGATVGSSGGIYQVSVDGGTSYGSGVALGTATAITLYGVTFTFQSGQTVDGTVGCLLIPASESVYNIDLSGVTGTSEIAISGTPNDAHDCVVNVTLGGNPGFDGIRLAVSLDGGRRFAPVKRLGTSLTFAIDDREDIPSGITLTFNPVVDADIIAFVADLRTKFLAHEAGTTWHTNADPATYTITTPTSIAAAITAMGELLASGAAHVIVRMVDAVLVAFVADLRTKFLAHEAGTTWHTDADPATYTITTPTNITTAITAMGELRTSGAAHANVVGTTHGAADTTANTDILAITPPTNASTLLDAAVAFHVAFFGDGSTVDSGHTLRTAGTVHNSADATNLVADPDYVHNAADTAATAAIGAIDTPTNAIELLAAATAFREAFFGDGSTANSGHTLRITSSVHNSGDGTNLIALDDPEYATLETDDKIVFKTTAPEPQASDVVAAMQVLKESIYVADYDFIHIVAEADQTFAGTISDKLDSLELASTYTLGIMSARDRACGLTYDDVTGADYPGEALGDWSFRLDLAFGVFSGERVAVGAGMRRATNPVTLWTKRVPVAWTAVNRLLTRPVQEELGRKKAGQVAAKTAITNASNDYVEYNARNDSTLVDRFVVLRDFEDADGLYFAKGSTMAPSGSDFSLVTYIRVMNFATRLFKQVGQEQLGNGLTLETTGPRAGKASEVALRRLDREIRTAIESKVSPTKGTASGLSIRASRDDNLLPVVGGDPPTLTADVVIVPLGYVGGFRGRIRMASTLPTV